MMGEIPLYTSCNNPLGKPRIVIVGAGFGGLFCAKGLEGADACITLIDRQNYHLFQPLLYQVATGFLGINDVALPIRSLFRDQENVEVVMAEVMDINATRKLIITEHTAYPYDYLVLATGAEYHFFGHNAWEKHVLVLKTLEDAIAFRQRILSVFEQAEYESDEARRKALLTFVIIGGGPTGVEMAGAIADAVNYALKREFRHIRPEDVMVLIVEAASTILGGMPRDLSLYAVRVLGEKGVRVECNTSVTDIQNGCVFTDKGLILTHTILWAAGVKPRPISHWLDVETDKRGAIPVLEDLSIKEHRHIFVIGDAAAVSQKGKTLSALAAVAKQEGKYLAELLKYRLEGKSYKPFHYWDYGTMATIGRNEAVADFGWFTLKGWIAWIVWGIVHIYYLTGFRNRTVVFFTWVWTYLSYGMGARILIRERPSTTVPNEVASGEGQKSIYEQQREKVQQGDTMSQLRDDIDTGKTGDKVIASDPAAAPLGTDDEAAGTPPDPRLVKETRERETRKKRKKLFSL